MCSKYYKKLSCRRESARQRSLRRSRSFEVNDISIGVDLAGILRGRMGSAEGGFVPRGMGYGEGCPFRSRLDVWGSVVSSLSGVRGRAPAKNGFWRILKATGRSFFVPI